MDLQSMFTVKRNKGMKRFEFEPTVDGLTGYYVSFHECDNEDDAWIALYKAMKLEGKA